MPTTKQLNLNSVCCANSFRRIKTQNPRHSEGYPKLISEEDEVNKLLCQLQSNELYNHIMLFVTSIRLLSLERVELTN
ncbi:hypothetical protein TSAR_005372, partial [Trichomalopsis sarcophagae]